MGALTTAKFTTRNKIINLLPPKDITGGATSSHINIFDMANYDHATIIIKFGVVNASADIGLLTVEKCTNVGGSNNTAMAFSYRIESTAAGDTLDATAIATSTGYDVDPVFADANSTMIVIEIRAEELVPGATAATNWHCISVLLACSGHSVMCDMTAILSGARYQSGALPTAIV